MSIRKYNDPDTRAVRHEKLLFEFVSSHKLEHNQTYFLGACVLWKYYQTLNILTEEEKTRFSSLFDSSPDLIFPIDAIEEIVNRLITHVNKSKAQNESDENEPTLRIYNIADNEYQIIKRSEFSPLIHRMVTKGDSE